MKTWMRSGVCAAMIVSVLSGCADMTTRQRNAAIGAGIGGVAGSVLTDGNPWGVVGGAVVGGVIGHGTGSDRKLRHYDTH
nr:glycine zipper 2TM domain-containing protein [Andreprevotia chitinilytica]